MTEAPCHFIRPFLDRFGNLYPCCFKNHNPDFIIGNVSDNDLVEKLYNYDVNCGCDMYKFRKYTEGDKLTLLNIQTSLLCHGKCAVCYVSAPLKRENIELDYEKTYAFLEGLKADALFFEGGEVPLQKNALKFAAKVKKGLAPKKMHLLTNGCYKQDHAKQMADLFNAVTVSYMGFSDNVYYHETGLQAERTNAFCKEVHKKLGTIGFRYICTPLSVIEAWDFLGYAVEYTNGHVIYADCNLNMYAKEPHGTPYWSEVLKRCQAKFKEALLLNREKMQENNFLVKFEPRTAQLLGVTKEFADKFSLDKVVFY